MLSYIVSVLVVVTYVISSVVRSADLDFQLPYILCSLYLDYFYCNFFQQILMFS